MNALLSRHLRFSIWGISAAALLLFGGNTRGLIGLVHTVTQNGNSGPGSLRQAIVDSAPGDTVNFGVTGPITLTSGPIVVNKNLFIVGPGARNLNVTGFNIDSIFKITSGSVGISGLTVGPGNNGIVYGLL
jgi:hypothetical protein